MGIKGLPWRPYRTSNTIIMAAPFPVARFSRLLPEMLAASWSLIPVSSMPDSKSETRRLSQTGWHQPTNQPVETLTRNRAPQKNVREARDTSGYPRSLDAEREVSTHFAAVPPSARASPHMSRYRHSRVPCFSVQQQATERPKSGGNIDTLSLHHAAAAVRQCLALASAGPPDAFAASGERKRSIHWVVVVLLRIPPREVEKRHAAHLSMWSVNKKKLAPPPGGRLLGRSVCRLQHQQKKTFIEGGTERGVSIPMFIFRIGAPMQRRSGTSFFYSQDFFSLPRWDGQRQRLRSRQG